MVSCCDGVDDEVTRPTLSFSLSLQSKVQGAAGTVPEDQDRLLAEAKREVDKNALEMKSSLVGLSQRQPMMNFDLASSLGQQSVDGCPEACIYHVGGATYITSLSKELL